MHMFRSIHTIDPPGGFIPVEFNLWVQEAMPQIAADNSIRSKCMDMHSTSTPNSTSTSNSTTQVFPAMPKAEAGGVLNRCCSSNKDGSTTVLGLDPEVVSIEE